MIHLANYRECIIGLSVLLSNYNKQNKKLNTNNNNNNNNNNKCPGYDVKLHPVVEFRRGTMRLPFVTTTSRSPLSKV